MMPWKKRLFPSSGLLEESPDPILRVDKKGEVLFSNPAGELLLRALGSGLGMRLPEDIAKRLSDWDRESRDLEIETPCAERLYSFHISSPRDRSYLDLFGHDITNNAVETVLHDATNERKRNTVLVNLARSQAITNGRRKAALMEVTEGAACILDCDRVGIWLFNKDRTKIRCIDLYEKGRNTHSRGTELQSSDYPAYFGALEEERALSAHRACEDPRTRELADPYLIPMVINSILDAPIRYKGSVIGVICHEHVGQARHWRPEEEVFAGNMTEFITLAFQSRERRQAEQALRETEELLALAQQVGHVGTFEWNIQTGTSRWTSELEALHGLMPNRYAEPEIMREKRVNPDDWPEIMRRMRDAMGYGNIEGEWRIVWPDGSTHWLAGRAWIFKDKSGKFLRLIGISIDITERKEKEEELARALEELRRSNKDLEHFAYVASHDLQEPLRTIRAFLQILENRYKDKLDGEANDCIHFAIDGAGRLQDLILGLLQYSRIASGGSRMTPTDVSEVLRNVLDDLKGMIEPCETEVSSDELPVVLADAMQLRQLFQNLIGNAVKFRSPDRPCRIQISAYKREKEWIFSIKDNGIGIDPKYQKKIFTIFQRLYTTDKYPGSGIGLAVCQRIVERHGGRIWVQSKEDEGSTFYFTIRKDFAMD